MRVKLNDPISFFEEILNKNNTDLKRFSKRLGLDYSALKKYRRGDLTLPEELFIELLELVINKEYWLKNSERLEENWGAIKGGKVSALRDELNKRIAHARKFKKVKKINIKINKFFCEFYGALLGDGCITRFKDMYGVKRMAVFISGNKKLDSEYLKYLKEKINNEFKMYSYFYAYKNKNSSVLSIKNKGFSLFLHRFGFPIGEKYGKLKIPNRILKLPWRTQKMVIRGLFDTDGSICAKKREKYKYPQICITSNDTKILRQLNHILRNKGYPCWIGGNNIFIRGNKCVKRWMADIGSSNSRNLFKYNYWLKNGIIPKNLGS